MKRSYLLSLILIVFVPLISAQVKYTTPTCSGLHVSELLGISNNGLIVGAYYTDIDPVYHPLLINRGKCIPLGQNTILAQKLGFAAGVNDRGDVVGSYRDGGAHVGAIHGFLLDRDGVLTVLDFPSADDTYAWGVNESGAVVGAWSVNDALGNILFQHGCVWKDGNFRDVVYPAYYRTQLTAVNARGASVGAGLDPALIGHAFIYSRGEISPIIGLPPSAIGSSPQGINNKGEIVGQFFDESYTLHGYLKVGSVYTTVDFSGAMWTALQGINDAGLMVGTYSDSNWALHGFMAEIQK